MKLRVPACPRTPVAPALCLPAMVWVASLAGCGPASVCPTAYEVCVRLEPATHSISGETVVTLRRESPGGLGAQATLDFALNRALQVGEITAEGAQIVAHQTVEPKQGYPDDAADDQASRQPLTVVHHVVLGSVTAAPRLKFTYSGALVQDVEAGEKRGQIHNRLVAAHIGPEGIYLSTRGGWFPFAYRDPDYPTGWLTAYRLTAEPVAGMELVAGACCDEEASRASGKLVWNSAYPQDGLVLAGGAHRIKEREANGVQLRLHYSLPEDEQSREVIEKNTDMFLAAATGYLDRYQPLIGPFPFRNYTIVENFFSSGFAFPGFTLLNKALFQMGRRALGHGFLDHEMLHCWWGNGIQVDPTDGNWCEALTSYAANYYGYVLDGDDQGARNQRRNCCMIVSGIKPEEDKPLGNFERPDGPGREVGYNKGTMVFHMLATRIGQENFWSAMRRLTDEYMGKYANWKTLQELCEQEGRVNLERFVREWVRTGGAPRLELSRAVWLPDESALEVTIAQPGTAFELNVPLRLTHDDGSSRDTVIALDTPQVTVPVESAKLVRSVALDPDYHVLRRVRQDEMIPNGALTRSARELLIVADEPLSPFLAIVSADFAGAEGAKQVTRRTAADLGEADLAATSVLILGDAVRAAPVQALLARTDCPIQWEAGGFRIGETLYAAPGHSVLCTVHHPDLPGGAVTLYSGNSEGAFGRSDLLGFYRDSLVVFETTGREIGGETLYEARPIARRDFEKLQTLEVSRQPA